MEDNYRIINLLKSEQMTARQMAQLIGVQPSTLSNIVSMRNRPSLDLLQKIKTAFPALSSDWLFMGKGPMKLPLTEEKLLVDRQQSLPFGDSEVDDEGVSIANVSNSNDNISTEQKESSNNTHTVKAISNQKQITSENAPILDNISEETIIKSAASLTTASKDLQKIILLYNDGSFEVFQN